MITKRCRFLFHIIIIFMILYIMYTLLVLQVSTLKQYDEQQKVKNVPITYYNYIITNPDLY